MLPLLVVEAFLGRSFMGKNERRVGRLFLCVFFWTYIDNGMREIKDNLEVQHEWFLQLWS